MGRPTVNLPADHEFRELVGNEVHARPPVPVTGPAVVSALALFGASPQEAYAQLRELVRGHGVDLSPEAAPHAIVELPGFCIKWERHGEFVSLLIVRPLDVTTLEEIDEFPTAFSAVPNDWLAGLPGRTIAAADIMVLPSGTEPDLSTIRSGFDLGALGGAKVLDGAGWVFTDFLPAEGRTRWLVLDAGLGAIQRARLIQRVVEIETYRMVALLSLPPARRVLVEIERFEQRLEEITLAIAALRDSANSSESARRERTLLDELTMLAAEVEHSIAETAVRFSAGGAYWQLVQARIAELREQRVGDLRTLGGFLSRRTTPAMSSAAAAAARNEEVSARIERASTLLRTRVDIALEEQNQKLLVALDHRSHLSFRIQQAVEFLSIAAISYYGANVLELLLRPFAHHWPGIGSDWVVAGAIPVIAVGAWRLLERFKRGFAEI